MKMNKIICLMLALMISVSTFLPAFAEQESGLTEIEFLNELGIVKGYEDGELHPEYNITRMEYAALIIRCLGYDGEYPSLDNVFTDVPKDSWGAAAVQFAYDLGIINGYGDGRFGPDDNILEVDAVKIIVSALGCGLEAEAEGGYPTGYLSIAQRLKIMKNFKGGEEKATRAFVATLIANSLDIPIVEQNFTSNAFMANKGRTILSILGISRYKGKLTAVNGTNIASEENVYFDEVVISGRLFKTDKSFSSDFVGENVVAYVQNYGKEGEMVIGLFTSGEESENLVVEAKDISDKTDFNKFIYLKGNKEKEIDLPAGISIVYNGTLLDRSIYITPERLKPVNGSVKLIDTNQDRKYDLAIVKEYRTYVVKSVTEDAVYDIYGNNIEFKAHQENSFITVKKNGKQAKWEDVSYGDVLSIASNVDNTIAEIIICDKALNGEAISTATRDGKIYYGLSDGGEYTTSLEYNTARSKKHKEALEIELRNRHKFKFNAFGEIAIIEETTSSGDSENGESGESGENVDNINKKNKKAKYGFLCNAGLTINGMEEVLELKMLTTNNRIEIFTLRGTDKIRFGRPSGISYAIGKASPTEIYGTLLDSYDMVVRQIVQYVADEEGYISEFYIADSKKNTENLSMDTARTNYTFSYNTVGEKYYYDEDTVLFMLTGNGDRDTDIICTTPGRYLTNRKSYNSELWDIDSDGYINCIALYPATGESVNEVTKVFVIDVLNDSVMLVTHVGQEVNDEGVLYKVVEGYEDGKKVRRLMSDGLSQVATIRPGMIIQYGTNKDNLKFAYYADHDEVMLGYQEMFDCTELNLEPFVSYDHKTKKLSSFRMNYGYGTVTNVDYPSLTISTGNIKSTLHSEVMVLKYNRHSGVVEKVDTTHIAEGQKVFFRKRLENLREIIIFE